MGVSTDGQICFGIVFEEGHEFPWDDDGEGGIEAWWRNIGGYKPPFECFDQHGNYLPGFDRDDPRVNQYFDHQTKWEKEHPIPILLVNYQSCDVPAYIIAWPPSFKSASRGYPEELGPSTLSVDMDAAEKLIAFCQEHNIEGDESFHTLEPKWYLSSLWC